MENILKNAVSVISDMNFQAAQAARDVKKMQTFFSAGNLAQVFALLEKPSFVQSLERLKLTDLYADMKKAYDRQIAQVRIEFDKKFIEICNQIGVTSIKGNSMDGFQIRGIISVRINFNKNISEVGTYVISKKLNTLSPKKVAEEVRAEITRLFERPFIPMEFLKSLYQAYEEMRRESSRTLLLKDVHRVLWLKRQSPELIEKANPSKMVIYALDQYSVDLGKLIESGNKRLDNGYECIISLGANAINIYGSDGNFNSYKFLEFKRGGDSG